MAISNKLLYIHVMEKQISKQTFSYSWKETLRYPLQPLLMWGPRRVRNVFEVTPLRRGWMAAELPTQLVSKQNSKCTGRCKK